jgi:UDP-glucose 4-epimerase
MKWSNKLVLLTGAAGFIGSHLLRRLVKLGAEVIAIDDLSVGGQREHQFL